MPAASKTSDDAIARAARKLVESSEDFSMGAVAEAVGVATPSLYKRYADREALLARVRRDTYGMLQNAIVAQAGAKRGAARLRAMAGAYRTFALGHPRLYALLFAPDESGDAATQQARLASVEPVLEALRELAGDKHALDAARTFTAFLHGHLSMLLSGAFHLGGDVDAAFAYGLDRILAGIALDHPRRRA
jgi:AcrR family transcriptional regulator